MTTKIDSFQEDFVPINKFFKRDDKAEICSEKDFLNRLRETLKKDKSNTYLIGIKLKSIYDIQKNYGQEIKNYYLKNFRKKVKIIFKNNSIFFIDPDIFIVIVEIEEKKVKAYTENIQKFLSGPIPFKGGLLPTKIFLTFCPFKKVKRPKILIDIIVKVLLEEKRFFSIENEERELNNNLSTYLSFSKRIIMGEIGFALQPVIDSKTRKIVFYEALARIQSPQEIITAQRFIKFAEILSLKRDIERNILYKTIFFLKKYPNIKHISVNISPDYLFEGFEKNLKRFLEEIKVNPERIWFEITEQSQKSIANFSFKEKLLKLKNQGFKVILDDFGQYHSNLNLLKEFNWDIVKIDGNFIKNILQNEFDLKFVEFLVELAKIQNFQIVAEYVENKKIARKLKDLGVHFLQGFYCGRPSFIPLSQKIIPPLIY